MHNRLKLIDALCGKKCHAQLLAGERAQVVKGDVARLSALAQHPHNVTTDHAHLGRGVLSANLKVFERNLVG